MLSMKAMKSTTKKGSKMEVWKPAKIQNSFLTRKLFATIMNFLKVMLSETSIIIFRESLEILNARRTLIFQVIKSQQVMVQFENVLSEHERSNIFNKMNKVKSANAKMKSEVKNALCQ